MFDANPLLILTEKEQRTLNARIGDGRQLTPWRVVAEGEGVQEETIKNRVEKAIRRMERHRIPTETLRQRLQFKTRKPPRVRDATGQLVARGT